ncbi:hypothetical protein [Salipiger abyssi]|uniref:hypothetical protein n=1 Tax=Salipiger abyssi TaxID=1250539 RepID=UPI001A8D7798|nr:hypothetical protein [Salipiger abyssi]MBN9890104.1 hypothetical protein [Salipiger abyssi]
MSRFSEPHRCPFCGGVLPLLALAGEEGRRFVMCHGCEARGPVEHSDLHAVSGFEGDAGFEHLSEIRDRLQRLYQEWAGLEKTTRPDFLTFAHHRRNPELGGDADG